MHKFYWNNKPHHHHQQQQQQQQQRRGQGQERKYTVVNLPDHQRHSGFIPQSKSEHNLPKYLNPQIPARDVKTVVRVTDSGGNNGKKTPTGSHRVLLKLRKLSAAKSERPRSIHGAESLDNDDAISVKSHQSYGKLSTSKSHYEFYHRTWNERSLAKYSNQHNYENVYSGPETGVDPEERNPDYENFPFQHPEPLVIHRMTGSPRTSGGRRTILPESPIKCNPVFHQGNELPIPPARKGRKEKHKAVHDTTQRPLYRSKSCERPTKMKDAVRDTLKIITNESDRFQSNLNKFSANLTGKILHKSSILNRFSCVNSNKNVIANSHTDEETSATSSNASAIGNFAGQDEEVSKATWSLSEKMKQKFTLKTRSKSAERICQREHVRKSGSSHTLSEPHFSTPSIRSRIEHLSKPDPEIIDPRNFVGRARALVDCTPTPYDREALSFKKGDIIDVISMDACGLWRGHIGGRVGHFKFISVELMAERNPRRRKSSTSSRKSQAAKSSQRDDEDDEVEAQDSEDEENLSEATMNSRPKSVKDLLTRIGLEQLTSLFVLNGFEDLNTFREITERELDSLNILEAEQRSTIMTAVELLQEYTSSSGSTTTVSEDENLMTDKTVTPVHLNTLTSKPDKGRDSGCYDSDTLVNGTCCRLSPTASDRSSRCSAGQTDESGIHTTSEDERETINERFAELVEKYKCSNNDESNRIKVISESKFQSAKSVFEQNS